MVMIVRDPEKPPDGFFSVTRLPRPPRRPAHGGLCPADVVPVLTRGGGRGALIAAPPARAQGPHVGLGRAPVRAVMLVRGRAGGDEDALAPGGVADAEAVYPRLGDQAGQPRDAPCREPVGGRPAVHQMDVPVLAIVAGDLLVQGMPGE